MIAHRREGMRLWPIIPAYICRVLDVGCGNGDALGHEDIGGLGVGIDISYEALRTASEAFPRCCFSRAAGEAIPFSDGAFDAAISRVALPYMNIPEALAEIARILRPGGEVWFVLHHFSVVKSALTRAIQARQVKGVIYFCYVVVNGITFNLVGRNFRYPLQRKRCESFQTEGGVIRALAAAGFEQIRIVEALPLAVTARKRALSTSGNTP